MRRREFLILSATSIGGVLVYSLDRRMMRLSAEEKPSDKSVPSGKNPNNKIKVALRFFSQAEALIVAAAASRIMPSDETGPGAKEAGVVIYIDRQLAGPWGRDRWRYTHEPFDEHVDANFGYQGAAPPRQVYRDALKGMAGFDVLPAEQQDAKLRQMEDSLFFKMLRSNTIEGMFCDPIHGGNVDMVGWQMVGFPGPRMTYYSEVDTKNGVAYRPKLVSLEQICEHPETPLEDETT